MVMRPSEIHAELSELMAGFDAGLYAVADCERLVSVFADVERMAGYAKGLCMVRVADAGRHRGRGDRSPAAGLGDAAGMDPAAAARAVRNARRAAKGSASDAAARKGKVSSDAAADAADAAGGDPEVEARLIDTTITQGPRAGRDAAAAVRRAASEAADRARAQRIVDRRGMRHWVDRDGVGHLGWAGNPIDLAHLLAALHPWALATGEPNPSKAKADGLVAMARAAQAPVVRNGRAEPRRTGRRGRVDPRVRRTRRDL